MRESGLLKCIPTIAILLSLVAIAAAEELPAVSDRAPVPASHFPDPLHAVVWRNWQLVEPARLAAVLGTTADKVCELAASMGLPRDVVVPPEMRERGYITLVRRNWHLLPYEQLVQLLDITPDELAFRLREDDFLYIKLGSLKPRCQRVEYRQPDAAAQQRASEIHALVEGTFGDRIAHQGEPRFAFVTALSRRNETQRIPSDKSADNSLRFVYSYFAVYGDPLSDPTLDPYPDGLLARLRDHGANGVWLHTVLRQLAPGGPDFPEFGAGHEARLANLRKLVERAKRFGIDVYLYLNEPRAMPKAFFKERGDMAGVEEGDYVAMCTSNPRVRGWVADSLAYVFRAVPDLGGVFTITASENLTNCASHAHRENCPRCKPRSSSEILAEVNATIADGVHRAAPDAKVILYDWCWSSHASARDLIDRLPPSVWVMSVSEWSLPIERGGVKSSVGEYSISAVGPGPQALQHWQWAKARGLKTVAKVQFNNSWELSAVPYLPVLDLVAEHCENLARAGVDGLMLGWSLGGYPSPNLQVAERFAARPAPDGEAVLQAVAERHFGAAAAPRVRQAWTKFSQAFAQYPFSIAVVYHGPQHCGPANLLYGQPTGYTASMIGIPYDDLKQWRGPYPPEVFAHQFQKVADGWSEGLAELRAAQPLVPHDKQGAAAADLRVAEAAHLHFASTANQARFVMARDALAASSDKAEQRRLQQELLALLDRENDLAKRLFALASADSRLGYEASNHYFYVPLDLVEKVVNCEYLKDQFAVEVTSESQSQ